MFEQDRVPVRFKQIAFDLRHRLRAAGWWREMMIRYPGGLVNSTLAARMLGVSPNYVYRMGKCGRLTRIDPPPAIGGHPLFSVDELLQLGTALERGRPREWQACEPCAIRSDEAVKQWGPGFVRPTVPCGILGNDKNISAPDASRKSLTPLWLENVDPTS